MYRARGPEKQAREAVREEAIRQCMQDKGFSYTPYYGDPAVEARHDVMFGNPAYSSEQDYIAHQVQRVAVSLDGGPEYGGQDTGQDYSGMNPAEIEAFEEALRGDDSGEDSSWEELEKGSGPGARGCRDVADQATYGDYRKYGDLFDSMQDIASMARSVAQYHPEVIAVRVKRDECWNEKISPDERDAAEDRSSKYGGDYGSDQPVPDDIVVALEESAEAEAEAECDISSGFAQKQGVAFHLAEERVTQDNENTLVALKEMENYALEH